MCWRTVVGRWQHYVSLLVSATFKGLPEDSVLLAPMLEGFIFEARRFAKRFNLPLGLRTSWNLLLLRAASTS